MAKIQSATMTNASGSIGGMTFAKNRGGLYLRARAAVTNPQTAGQTLVRLSLAVISTMWRTLTLIQRDGWSDWAAVNPITNVFGDPLLMTGHQAFIALNTPRQQAALAVVEDAPVGFGQPIPPAFLGLPTLIIDDPAVDLTINVKTAEDEAGDFLVYISKPQSPTTIFFKGPYNLAKVVAKPVGLFTTPIVLDETVLPAVAAGQVLYFRLRLTTDTGRLSAEYRDKVTAEDAP